jgi:hypothetical protein
MGEIKNTLAKKDKLLSHFTLSIPKIDVAVVSKK